MSNPNDKRIKEKGTTRMKLVMAIDKNKQKNSKLSEQFGHCPYFALYETDKKNLEIFENKLDYLNQYLTPIEQVMKFKPNIVFSKKIIKIEIRDYKNLKNITENLTHFNNLAEVSNN